MATKQVLPNGLEVLVDEHKTPETAPRGHVVHRTVEIDGTKQLLSPKLRSFEAACLHVPPGMQPEAAAVLRLLFGCFEKQRAVKEGLIGDILWGFSQAGHDPRMTLAGLNQLQAAQYVHFQAPDGAYLRADDDQIGKAWVRYGQKLLDMVYEGGTK